MPSLSEEIRTRDEFALLCNWRNLRKAVEVGTERGVFAASFMSKWDGDMLVCVDDWQPHEEHIGGRRGELQQAVLAVQPYGKRVYMCECDSVLAAQHAVPWHGPEFIYIDAAHDYESVKRDIEAWWPRLSSIGIFAGHDYDEDHPGVVQAVDEFAEANGLTVWLTEDSPASWYVYKNPPDKTWKRVAR